MRNHWNSTFQIRADAKRLQSKSKLKRSAMKRATKPIRKAGRRTLDWRKAWRFLKPRLEAAGRTRCEFSFIPHECTGFLTPAHSKKRRMMKGQDIYRVALACVNVHRILDEQMTHVQMEVAVTLAIKMHGGLILPECS